VIGFDEMNSSIRSWLGLEKLKKVGQIVMQGMGDFLNDHSFPKVGHLFLNRTIGLAFYPFHLNQSILDCVFDQLV
jgi:hypothetical protein